MTTKKRIIHILPKQWNYPFLSAWRVFERTLNPAFIFIVKCTSCGATGDENLQFVMSTKKPKALLGLECTKCLQTIKFEDVIDPDADDFPKRLQSKPNSVLTIDGKAKSDQGDSEGYLELMFGDE